MVFPGRLRAQVLALFLVAFAVRMTIAVVRDSAHNHTRAEMERAALSLATTGVLGNVYAVPTGPSGHIMPGYAAVLAAIYRVFGTGTEAEFVKIAVSSAISSAQYALLPVLGARLALPPAVGLIAGALGAVVPLKPYTEIQGDFEQHVTGLLLVVALIWTSSLWRSARGFTTAAAYGLLWGLATLVNASLLATALVLIAATGWFARRRVAWAAVAAAALLATLSPWAVRNYVALGSPVLTRTNFGLEFDLSNNPNATPLLNDNIADRPAWSHPYSDLAEAIRVRDMGEVAYNRMRLERALGWVWNNPSAFLTLTAQRVWYTWFPLLPETGREWALRALTPLALIGWLILWRQRRSAAMLFALVAASYTPVYYVLQVHVRYRYPIDFLLLLSAVFAAWAAWSRLRRRFQKAATQAIAA